MSTNWQQDIHDFHVAMGHKVSPTPTIQSEHTKLLRIRLIKEEVGEVLDALAASDLVELADGIVDAIVVLLGTAVSYGIDIQPIWDEVHGTNMAKQGGGKDEGGKSLKPVGWQPPRVRELLVQQGAMLW